MWLQYVSTNLKYKRGIKTGAMLGDKALIVSGEIL